MGCSHMFTEHANFSEMSESDDLVASDVLHKAVIDLNENGTEASAATGNYYLKHLFVQFMNFFVKSKWIHSMRKTFKVYIYLMPKLYFSFYRSAKIRTSYVSWTSQSGFCCRPSIYFCYYIRNKHIVFGSSQEVLIF